ncbi:MAG: radical SAM protein, partial [Puniceicoccales bacterium]
RVRDFTVEKAQAWREAGANRFSLGLQSADEGLRRRLGRLAGREEILKVLNGLADTDAVLIVDLMFGLPGQDRDLLLEDLRFLAEETRIDGLDLYELIQFPNSPLAKAVEGGRLGVPADRAGRAQLFGAAAEALAGYGFEHFTPQHWRRGTRERSVYNRLAKSNADILPIGSSAGGNLSRVSIMMERDIDTYAAAIEAGNIPARCLAPTGPMGSQERFKSNLSEFAEHLKLPPVDLWPEEAQAWAKPLLDNWREAGLIKHAASGEDAFPLTMAGSYWIKTMHSLLLGCLAPAEAGSPIAGHPHAGGGGHPGGMPPGGMRPAMHGASGHPPGHHG